MESATFTNSRSALRNFCMGLAKINLRHTGLVRYHSRCLGLFSTVQERQKSQAVKHEYRARYPRRSELSEEELWTDLFQKPHDWWDHRKERLSERSPDFKHYADHTKALWIHTYKSRIVKPHIRKRLDAMDSSMDPSTKPRPAPSQETAFKDLLENPDQYEDLRSSKRNPKAPDFKHIRTHFPIWVTSVPSALHDRLDDLIFGNLFKPKLSFGEDDEDDKDDEVGDDIDKEGFSTAAKEELQWSESDLNAAKVLLDFEPDLTEEAEPPEGWIHLELKPYQRQGLAWLLKREQSHELRGGLLCDEQGLGKTLQALSLIASNPWQPLRCDDDANRRSSTRPAEPGNGHAVQSQAEAACQAVDELLGSAELPIKATLVLAPAGLLAQWLATIQQQTKLKVLLYADTARSKHQDPAALNEFDIVLASYDILRHDQKKDMVTYRVQWWRIVCDEIHKVKNHARVTAAAVSALQVQPEGRRWGLTGTPIQNKPEDMFAYLNFLRHPLYEKHDAFKRDFTFSSNRSLRVALQQLRDVVRPLLLRRSKSSTIDGKPILELPRKIIAKHKITPGTRERVLYQNIESWCLVNKLNPRKMEARRAIEGLGSSDGISILTALLNLRRACNHPSLASGFWNREDPVADLRENASDLANLGDYEPSAKTMEVIKIAQQYPDEKINVFSNWLGTLDLVQAALIEHEIGFQRLDGDCDHRQRHNAIEAMRNNPENRIFLISLGAGKEGLNLQFCSRVILMEPDYNPFKEEQAMDRCHRIGQTKDVHVHKFYIEDTFETQIMQLQDFKLRVAQEVIPDSAGKADQRGITDEILSSWITSIQERHCDVHKNKPSLSLPALRASMMKESSSRSNAAEAA